LQEEVKTQRKEKSAEKKRKIENIKIASIKL
jgi:hypothetical protein